jgi:hypothetical protein
MAAMGIGQNGSLTKGKRWQRKYLKERNEINVKVISLQNDNKTIYETMTEYFLKTTDN